MEAYFPYAKIMPEIGKERELRAISCKDCAGRCDCITEPYILLPLKAVPSAHSGNVRGYVG